MESLGIELPKQMARIRDDVLPHFDAIGPAGAIGAMLIRADLDAAARALAEGDVIAMIGIYQRLKEIES